MSATYTYDKLDQPGVTEYIFQPPQVFSSPCPAGAEDMHIDVDAGASLHLRFFPADNHEQPCILFFHGNGETVSDYDDVAAKYSQRGLSFIGVEYRGYGLATGTASVTTMMADSHLIFQAVCDWRKKNNYTGKFFVMGRSLGSASAIELAWSHPDKLHALLIDSGFAMTMPVLVKLGVDVAGLGLNEQDGFHNLDKIKTITMATYIIHGQLDELISLTNASELIAESPALQKEFQTVPGAGHNTIMDVAGDMYYEVIGRFFNKVGKIRKKRAGVR